MASDGISTSPVSLIFHSLNRKHESALREIISMNYLAWSILALVTYSFVAPLMSVATTGAIRIPSNSAALIANSILIFVTVFIVLLTNENTLRYLSHPKIKYVVLGGVCLTAGILSYYKALSTGPVSVVSPIFGMFLVLSSVIGFVFLNESASLQKLLGIAFAVIAVVLVSTD
jgi:transporter family protein